MPPKAQNQSLRTSAEALGINKQGAMEQLCHNLVRGDTAAHDSRSARDRVMGTQMVGEAGSRMTPGFPALATSQKLFPSPLLAIQRKRPDLGEEGRVSFTSCF